VDPLNDYLSALDGLSKEAARDLKRRQKREFQMWQDWKQGGMQPQQLRPLIKSFQPLINGEANRWAPRIRDLPPAAIRAEFTDQFVNALRTYDPNRGAALNTHIRHQLKKAQRFVTTYQNPGRIPENRIYQIRKLQDAEQRLDEQFGRMPTALELADEMKVSPRQVELLQKEVRRSLPTSQFEADPSTHIPSTSQQTLRLLQYDLNDEERQVFEYLYGMGGKPKMGPGAISRQLGMSAPKVSRLKKSIAEKYKGYIK